MMDSILNTIKQMLGIPIDDTAFDTDIIANINSTLMILNQLGVGPSTVFSIESNSSLWSDFLTDVSTYQAVKTYIFLKVKLFFDPPVTSFVLDSMKSQILELEVRLAMQVPIPPVV